MRDRNGREPMDGWALLAWLLVLATLALVLIGAAMDPAPEPPTARERAAQNAGQEAYYEVLERYGDREGAVEAARLVYEAQKKTAHGGEAPRAAE